MKCDYIVVGATCNNENNDPSGLCAVHRYTAGPTLRQLRADLATTRARLEGTTSAIPAIVANHTKSLTEENKRLRSGLESIVALAAGESYVASDVARTVLSTCVVQKPPEGAPSEASERRETP